MNYGIDVVGHMKLVNGQSGDSKGEACVGSCAVTRVCFLLFLKHFISLLLLTIQWQYFAVDLWWSSTFGTRLQETSAKNSNHTKAPPPCYWSRPLTPRVSEVQFLTLENFLTFRYLLFLVFKWVLLNTTGTLALTSMSSSRVFMDCDVQPTVDYFSW